MKKSILIAALFAFAGIANAQNAAPSSAPAPAGKPAASAEAANPADAATKTEGQKKTHAHKHAKHSTKKDTQAKAAGAETVKADAPAAKKDASAPAK